MFNSTMMTIIVLFLFLFMSVYIIKCYSITHLKPFIFRDNFVFTSITIMHFISTIPISIGSFCWYNTLVWFRIFLTVAIKVTIPLICLKNTTGFFTFTMLKYVSELDHKLNTICHILYHTVCMPLVMRFWDKYDIKTFSFRRLNNPYRNPVCRP